LSSRTFKIYFAVLIAAAGFACGGAEQPTTTANNAASPAASAPAPTAETAAVRSGKDLYAIHCLTCHKVTGKGGKVMVEGKTLNPDDLTSANMKAKSDEKLYNYIADGIEDEGMPAFKDTLKPEEIRAVVAHLRSLQN
jgi:mono/diheme cytochrome c family protein